MFVKSDLEKAKERKADEYFFNIVAQELKNNIKHDATWAKAIAKSYGDTNKAESYYIKYRIDSIKDEMILNQESKEKEQLKKNLAKKALKEKEKLRLQEIKEIENRENMLIGFKYMFFIAIVVALIVFFI